MTPDTDTTAKAPASDAARDRLRNVAAFEANLGGLKAAFPGLRMERTRTGIEWFIRSSRTLSADGIALKGSLSIDAPCDEDTAELLDAMAYANDGRLDRKAAEAELRREAGFLKNALGNAVDLARSLARRDLAQPGVRRDAYLAALSRELSAVVELFPAGCEDGGKEYRPGNDLRDRVRAACAAALKASRSAPARGRGGKARDRSTDAPRSRGPARASRPIRMRRWSPLYE